VDYGLEATRTHQRYIQFQLVAWPQWALGSAGYILLTLPLVCRRLRGSPDPIRRGNGSRRVERLVLYGFASEFASSHAFPLVAVAEQSDLLGQALGRPTPGGSRRSLSFQGGTFSLSAVFQWAGRRNDLVSVEISADLLPAIEIDWPWGQP
jgi:hypothetical protein